MYWRKTTAKLSTEEKQGLLEMTDPHIRLKSEKRLLRRQIKEMEALKISANESSPDAQEEFRIIFAERLDTTRQFWRTYLQDGRN